MVFSDAVVQFCLIIKVLFKLPLRQTIGMVASLPKMANEDRAAPKYTTLARTVGRCAILGDPPRFGRSRFAGMRTTPTSSTVTEVAEYPPSTRWLHSSSGC
jgi:Transposase DDE domain